MKRNQVVFYEKKQDIKPISNYRTKTQRCSHKSSFDKNY